MLNLKLKYAVTTKRTRQGVISDPLGHTHSHAISDNYFHLKVVLCCEIMKSKDVRRTYGHV